MRKMSFWTVIAIVVCLAFAVPGFAVHKNGEHGKKPPGGDRGGSEPTTPAEITFRDCTGGPFGDGLLGEPCLPDSPGFLADRIQSDFLSMTVFSDYTYSDQEPGVAVFLGSSANRGNIFLKGEGSDILNLFPPMTRTLFLDFSNCAVGSCIPAPAPGNFRAAIRVEVNKAIKNGVFALGVVDDQVNAPMTVGFVTNDLDVYPNWFIHFDPRVKKCGGSSQVNVRRTVADPPTWEVTGGVGCLTFGAPASKAVVYGLFNMPFGMTVEEE